MVSVAELSLFAVASATAFSLWKALELVWCHPHKSPLRHLRGPKGTSWILGNLGDVMNDENNMLIAKWLEEYGGTLRFKRLWNNDALLTVDTRAVNHILTHTNDYHKPPETRRDLAQLFGEGLLIAEGTQHHRQRRIMNPAFGPAQIRALTATFFAKANRLRDLWSAEMAKDPAATITGMRIDIVPWLSRVTLDIIGLTGFNYDFDALDSSGRPNELSEAFSTMFSASQRITVFGILQALFPVLRVFRSAESRKIQAAQRTMTQIGNELLTKAKAATLPNATEKGEMERDTLHGRDLLTLLVNANMADASETQKLSDKDVIAQVPTFFVAGHETTSTAVTWALYAMTQAPEVQTKLRDELLSVDTDTPSMDELVALPYLDAVDDELPVDKPYTDRYGVVRDTITIAKGDWISIPILEMNRSKELWGPDAHEFKPDRWNDIPGAVSQIPGVWGHLLTFIGGPRACIGYRFSLVETKAILFSLVRAFEYELDVPASDVRSRTAIVQRPVLRHDPTHQPQLPLLVKPYRRT